MSVQLEQESNTVISKYQIKASGVGNMVPSLFLTPNIFWLEVPRNIFPKKEMKSYNSWLIPGKSYTWEKFRPFQAPFFSITFFLIA